MASALENNDEVTNELAKAASKSIADILRTITAFSRNKFRRMQPGLESMGEDVAHDAFMHALAQIKQGKIKLKNRQELRRWLHGATRYITSDEVRRSSREQPFRADAAQGSEEGPGGDDGVNPVDQTPDYREEEPGAILVAEDLLERLFQRLGSSGPNGVVLQKVLLVRLATQQVVENLLMELAHRVTDQVLRKTLLMKLAKLQQARSDPGDQSTVTGEKGIRLIADSIEMSRATVHRELNSIQKELGKIAGTCSAGRDDPYSSWGHQDRPGNEALAAMARWLQTIIPDVALEFRD